MRLNIHPLGCTPSEILEEYRLAAPDLPEPSGSGRLGVVGGGPSIRDHVDELRSWPGDLWAINGAWNWCRDHDIDAWFFSIDPLHGEGHLVQGADKVILSDQTCPEAWLAASGDVRRARNPYAGPTSAVAASVLSIRSGYDGATFFGCEGSYPERGLTHAYETPDNSTPIRLTCGHDSFLIKLELILQVEQLSDVIRTLPARFSEESGGFLRAMIEHDEYDVTHVTPDLYAQYAANTLAADKDSFNEQFPRD